jgi:hypothetical protein
MEYAFGHQQGRLDIECLGLCAAALVYSSFHVFTVHGHTTMDRAEELVVLPPTLKKYVRFMVLCDPVSLVKHSYPISGVQSTEGASYILNFLEKNVQRKHRKKSVVAWLCDSVIRDYRCCLGVQCPNVHVTNQGYKNRRLWAKTYPEKAKKGNLYVEGGEEGEEATRWRKGASRYTHKPYATSNSVAASCHANWLAAVGLPNIRRLRETRMRLQRRDQSDQWTNRLRGRSSHLLTK